MRGLSAALVLLVSACSLMPGAPNTGFAQSDEARLALQNWTLKARLTTPENRAYLRWQQQADEFNIVLRGAFGLGGVRISGTPQRAEIDDGENLTVSLDPQADIYQRTGLWVPVGALPYWLRGLAAPGTQARYQRDELGRLLSLQQQGWVVNYADWNIHHDIEFPMWIELQREQPVLSLEVTRWKIP